MESLIQVRDIQKVRGLGVPEIVKKFLEIKGVRKSYFDVLIQTWIN